MKKGSEDIISVVIIYMLLALISGFLLFFILRSRMEYLKP